MPDDNTANQNQNLNSSSLDPQNQSNNQDGQNIQNEIDSVTQKTDSNPQAPPLKPIVEETSTPPVAPLDENQNIQTPLDNKDPGQEDLGTLPPPPPPGGDNTQEENPQPIPDIPPVVSSPKPKKKLGGKKIVATVLGILFLVGGIGAGVILVQNEQDIREKAYIVPPIEPTLTPVPTETPLPTLRSRSSIPPSTPSPTEAVGGETSCLELAGTGYDCIPVGQSSGRVCGPFPGCGAGLVCCLVEGETGGVTSPSPISQQTNPPTESPSGTTPSAQCLDIKAYDTDWNVLTNNDLSTLKAGDIVRFAVSGTTNAGTIDSARFTINGVLRTAVTQKNSSGEFYDEYTISEGITSFSISAELHHTDPSIGWF